MDRDINKFISQELRSIRKQLGITQSFISKKLGVANNTLSRNESGEYPFSIATIINLCELYKVDFPGFMKTVYLKYKLKLK
jgi:transcriptional regulator with XRE-family HTH domain